MGIESLPRELRPVGQQILDEFRVACGDGDASAAWLADYEVLELRAHEWPEGADLEIYLPRPLIEDLANLDLASQKRQLEDLRGVPARARAGEGRFWLLREQGRARALRKRPFV